MTENVIDTQDDEPVLIRFNRTRAFLYFVPVLFFIGLSVLWNPRQWANVDLKGQLIFGALALILVYTLFILPHRFFLVLCPDGFVVHRPWSQRIYPWNEVRNFRVVDGPHATGIRIVWDLADASPHRTKLIRVTHKVNGYDMSLLDTFAVGAGELVPLLNDWQQRYGASNSSQP